MQQQVECQDEETLELKETYSSLQQEVDIKTKKLKKVRGLLGLLCSDIHMHSSFRALLDLVDLCMYKT